MSADADGVQAAGRPIDHADQTPHTDDAAERLASFAHGTAAMLLVLVGVRAGLIDGLAGRPLSADELAVRAGADAVSVREWLAGMTAAGLVVEAAGRHRLLGSTLRDPAICAYLDVVAGQLSLVDDVAGATRSGGGLPRSVVAAAYQPAVWAMNNQRVEADLVDHWLTAPGIRAALAAGGSAHEVGCGAGYALEVLARTFPAAWVVGHDVDPAAIAAARDACHDLPNVAVTTRPPGTRSADVVLAIDTVHHLPDPADAVAGWARALRPGGWCVVVEPDLGPEAAPGLRVAAAAAALFYCLPDAREAGGMGHGAAAPAERIRDWLEAAGLAVVDDIVSPTGFRAITGQAPSVTSAGADSAGGVSTG